MPYTKYLLSIIKKGYVLLLESSKALILQIYIIPSLLYDLLFTALY